MLAGKKHVNEYGEDMTSKNVIKYCSFCDKSESEVEVLIAANTGTFICESCVEHCTKLINEHEENKSNES